VTQHKKVLEIIRKIVTERGWVPTSVISGCAKGVDQFGQKWAEQNNINIVRKPALWNRYGITAGFIRNEEMFEIADIAIIIWDGKSKGTQHTLSLFEKSDKEYVCVKLSGSNS
jgi:hypothetical protein